MAQWMGACDSWWSLMMFGVFYRIVRNDADVDVLDCSWFFLYLAGHADREASPDCSILLSQRFPATNGGPYSKERTAALFVIYPPLRVELHCSILECVSPIIYDCACNTNTISLWLLFWNRNYIYIIYIYTAIVRSEFVRLFFANRTWIVFSYGPAVLTFYGRHPHLGWQTESCSHATVDSNVEQSIYVFLCY